MNGIRRIGLFHLLLVVFVQSARSLCNMPTAWLGSWYQRGMSSLLEITTDHVQTKGSCLGVLPNEQYYLFFDRLNRCTRCLLFIERHGNLLQYRESECSDADDLSNVTSCPNMIAPDAALYTLHRNDSKPQSCPIQAPFRLTSLRRDDSICRQASSSSYIGECANDNQFRLHLSPCSPYQRALDLQLACIGTWIDGFHTYFVARVLAADSPDRNNQYACFHFVTKHKDLASTVSLSMATDDSCRDLNSKYMSTVMTLASPNRQIENESNRSCAFPDEWQRYDWYSLNRTIQMIPTQTDLELRHLDGHGNHQRLHCLQTLGPFAYRIRSFTNCEATEECLRVHQRTNNVLELTLSDCHERRLKRTLTMVATGNSLSSCPSRIGHLLLESSHLHRQHHRQTAPKKRAFRMSVGCGNRQKLTIYNAEKDPESRLLTQTDTCLASWQSDDLSTTYLIAQSIHSNATYCLTFHSGDSILIRNSSRDCSSHRLNDETSISIYSAKLLNPCSRSQRLPVDTLLLLLILLVVVEHVR